MKALRIGMIAGLTALAATALALPSMMKDFNANYKLGKNSALTKAGCVVCHVEKNKPKLNPYGEALKKALGEAKTKKLSAEIFKKVETLDSDGDGATNGAEIKADTLPGDAKSKPAK